MKQGLEAESPFHAPTLQEVICQCRFFELRRQSCPEETSTDMTYSWRTFINWQVTQAAVILILSLNISFSGNGNTVAVITNLSMWGSDFPVSHVQARIFTGQIWSERRRKSYGDCVTMPTAEANLTEQYSKIVRACKQKLPTLLLLKPTVLLSYYKPNTGYHIVSWGYSSRTWERLAQK